MKTFEFTLAALLLTTALSAAQPRISGRGFNNAGAFQLSISGPADLEASTNLQSWTKIATLSEDAMLGEADAKKFEWRFYRLRGGSSAGSNVVGFVKTSVPSGKMALLGNNFVTPLNLGAAESRLEIFGTTNPAVKISLYANGAFTPHVFDTVSGTWTPALRPIRALEGFLVENVGRSPLSVKLSGELRPGPFNMAVPVGSSLVVPPLPQPGPPFTALGIPGKDGMQIHLYDEAAQKYLTSTYDTLENGWLPKPADYKPGRSFILKTPEAVTWTKQAGNF